MEVNQLQQQQDCQVTSGQLDQVKEVAVNQLQQQQGQVTSGQLDQVKEVTASQGGTLPQI